MTSALDTRTETRVVHCKREQHDLYIGRPGKWANPFSHKPNIPNTIRVGSREEAIRRYRKLLWQKIDDGRVTLEELAELDGKVLGCWCSPLSCHGDVLAAAAKWAREQLEA